VKIGIRTHPGREAAEAAAAEQHGAFGVLIEPDPATAAIAGAAAATRTSVTRLIVRTVLGVDHPVTLAEDLAVLDNISGGRVVALVDTGALGFDAAREDLSLLLAALTPRPVQHRGVRWQVPAGLEGHEAPDSIEVTPKPVQVEIPVWLTGAAAERLGAVTGDPVLADTMGACDATRTVQPAMDHVTGDREADRQLVSRWREAGATHLLLGADDLDTALPEIARYLIPEVAMPAFPRIVAEAMTPSTWTGPARYVTPPPAGGPT
jgi:alkanesulfonate monooxygenase SsuD/methylene tetrahydromethanopterin reductase-like flavin-dependent oxidoreductase (luciferase family)